MWRLLGRVFVLVLLFSFFSFGKDFERLCNEEVLKEDFNVSVIQEACLRTAKNQLKQKLFSNASWYFLLAGKNDKNIHEIQTQINDGMFINIGHSYLLKGNLEKATQFYRGYIDKEMQPNDSIQADFKMLNKLYPKKKELLEQGLKIWNRLYKPLLEMDSLYIKYDKEEKLEHYNEAISILKRIIHLRQNYSTKESDVLSTDYNNLALLYGAIGNYTQALKLSLLSLKIDKKILGTNHYQTAIDYSNLAYIYEKLSKFKKAKEYNLLAIEISKTLYGEKNHTLATTYNNLAYLYSSTGNYQEALKLYDKSLQIDTELLSENNVSLSITFNNIGEVYSILGDYPQAMHYYRKSLEIDTQHYGEHHTIIAHSYNNIAQIYELLEDYTRAEAYYKKALAIAKEKLDKNHPLLATIYANKGNLYYVMNNDKESFKNHKKALDIRIFLSKGEDSIDLALSYHAMGLLYQASQDYNKSLKFFQKTLEINKKLLDKDNIANSVTYSSMGTVYQQMNLKEKALEYYNKALILEKNVLGKNHKDLARSYNSLSLLYFSQKDNRKAYQYIKQSFQIFRHNKNQNFTLLDNTQRIHYTKEQNYYINNLLYLSNKNKRSKNSRFVLKHWLNYKGTLFEYQNILSMIKYNPKTPKDIVSDIDRLNLLNRELATLKTSKKKESKSKEIHEVEVRLSSRNDALKSLLNLKDINSTQIAQYLQAHQLYIDFARGNDNYYIFTIDDRNNISFQQIDQNRTQDIDQAIKAYKINTKNLADEINKGTKLAKYLRTSKKEAKSILSKLYNLLIKPYLKELIHDKTELILSPDGLLNYFPFEALYNGGYLVEDHSINYISSGKEFVRQTKLSIKQPQYEMILFANANFDAKVKAYTLGSMFGESNTQKKSEKHFKNLGDIEIEVIHDHYTKAKIFKEENATIENLMKVKSSKILHISTHGFILEDENILNPMNKAMLVFAGANKSLDTATITALQLSTLDLKDTELVVLSACQSGLGDIQSAEGVIGLPKALLQAGAKNVLMSLWTVSNEKTAMLMNSFYDNIAKKQDYKHALQNAKIKMIKLHPYYWSSFILSGL